MDSVSVQGVRKEAQASDLLPVLILVLPGLGPLRAVEDVLEKDVRRELVARRSLREKRSRVQFPGFPNSFRKPGTKSRGNSFAYFWAIPRRGPLSYILL